MRTLLFVACASVVLATSVVTPGIAIDVMPKSCTTSCGKQVMHGWAGNDDGNNYCNGCKCTNGLMMCTMMMCEQREVKCLAEGDVCKAKGVETYVVDRENECPEGLVCKFRAGDMAIGGETMKFCLPDPCSMVKCAGKCVVNDRGDAECHQDVDITSAPAKKDICTGKDMCGGFAGLKCGDGFVCVAGNMNMCAKNGGADCGGCCIENPCARLRCSDCAVTDDGEAVCGGLKQPVEPVDNVDPCSMVKCAGKCVVNDRGDAECHEATVDACATVRCLIGSCRVNKDGQPVCESNILREGEVCKSGGVETGVAVNREADCPKGTECLAKDGMMAIGGEVTKYCTAVMTIQTEPPVDACATVRCLIGSCRVNKDGQPVCESNILREGEVCKSGGVETGVAVNREADCPKGTECLAKDGMMAIGGEVTKYCTAVMTIQTEPPVDACATVRCLIGTCHVNKEGKPVCGGEKPVEPVDNVDPCSMVKCAGKCVINDRGDAECHEATVDACATVHCLIGSCRVNKDGKPVCEETTVMLRGASVGDLSDNQQEKVSDSGFDVTQLGLFAGIFAGVALVVGAGLFTYSKFSKGSEVPRNVQSQEVGSYSSMKEELV